MTATPRAGACRANPDNRDNRRANPKDWPRLEESGAKRQHDDAANNFGAGVPLFKMLLCILLPRSHC